MVLPGSGNPSPQDSSNVVDKGTQVNIQILREEVGIYSDDYRQEANERQRHVDFMQRMT